MILLLVLTLCNRYITKPYNRLHNVELNASKKLKDQSTCLTYLNHTKHGYKKATIISNIMSSLKTYNTNITSIKTCLIL